MIFLDLKDKSDLYCPQIFLKENDILYYLRVHINSTAAKTGKCTQKTIVIDMPMTDIVSGEYYSSLMLLKQILDTEYER